jgi:hypothetical protein
MRSMLGILLMRSRIFYSGCGFFFLSLSNLRYSTFWVLYPIGVAAELITTANALKDAYAWQPLYAAFIVVIMISYIPGILYPSFLIRRLLYAVHSYDPPETKIIRKFQKNKRGSKEGKVV